MLLLNEIWGAVVDDELLLPPRQKPFSKIRNGAKVTRSPKGHDPAPAPARHEVVTADDKNILAGTYRDLNRRPISGRFRALTESSLRSPPARPGPSEALDTTVGDGELHDY